MATLARTEELLKEDVKHLIHPITVLGEHERTGPLVIAEGKGILVWDSDGKEYIDGMAGLWNVSVGHGRSAIAEAIAEQAAKLAFCPSFWGLANIPSIMLGHKLAELTPPGLKRYFFTSGGSESNETALKIARYSFRMQGQEEKFKIVSREHAYHGVSYGALSATGIAAYWKNFGPTVPGFLHLPAPYCYRCPLDKEYPRCEVACASALEEAVLKEGPDTVAAFIAEPVMGVGGVIVPPPEYFPRIEKICREYGVLFITDEVITGFGRTGKMFAVEHWGVQPDLMSVAKAITSGYVPLGAVAVSEGVYEGLKAADTPFMHGFTYNAHPVACAAALANLDILVGEDLAGNAAAVGPYFLARLGELRRYRAVGDVRGLGLMAAVELVAEKQTKAKFDPAQKAALKVQMAARRHGLLCRAAGDTLLFAPPLIIDRQGLDLLVERLAQAIEDAGLA